MAQGELLTRWTIRVALALYLLALCMRIEKRAAPARILWTAGGLIFLLHLASAFHFYHHWSHADAYQVTARLTAEVVGLDWGGGVFANYLFAVLWLGDVAWWWCDPASYLQRGRMIECGVQGFLGFIAFNATVVFGTGFIRWFGFAACVLLLALAVHRFATLPRRARDGGSSL